MNTPLSCFGSSAACYLLNSRVEHKTSPIQFRQGTWITKVSPVQLQCFFRLKSKNIWCVWNEEQPGKEAYQGSRPDHWPVTSSYVALKPSFLKSARSLPLYSLDELFEVYGGCFGFVQKLVDAAERTSACADMPEEPNSCWNIMELVGSPFVGPATWAFGRPKGSLLYQMLFRLSLESGFTIKFSTFSRLFIRKLGLYSWICTGELL